MSLDMMCDDVLNLIGTYCNFDSYNLRISCKSGKVISEYYWELVVLYRIIRYRYKDIKKMHRLGLIRYTKLHNWDNLKSTFKKIKDKKLSLDLQSNWDVRYITQYRTVNFLTEKSIIEKLIFVHVFK